MDGGASRMEEERECGGCGGSVDAVSRAGRYLSLRAVIFIDIQ